jgi:hypothetical protein
MHRTGDPNIEVGHARYLAQQIPNAKLIELSRHDHPPWLGNRDAVLAAVGTISYWGESRSRSWCLRLSSLPISPARQNGSQQLGDKPWLELLSEFYRRTREVLQDFRGREISTAGDGFFATFEGPARAIRCAKALNHSMRSGLGNRTLQLAHHGCLRGRGAPTA